MKAERRKITFQNLRKNCHYRGCTFNWDTKKSSYWCEDATEDGSCSAKNCPIWKRLEKV